MIDRTKLLTDLQALLRKLEADLLERSDSSDVPEVGETLRAEYQRAKQAERTAQSYEEWRSDSITQMASAWVLSGVFVRFLEDNKLVDPPIVSGTTLTPSPSPQGEGNQTELDYLLPGEKGAGGMRAENRLQRARDEHELYFRDHPKETDREYWLHGFDRIAQLPGTREIFGENNRIRDLPNWLSGDAAGELLRFFQRVEPETGKLVHDFTDEQWDTRFLGDLYQDVSEAARKKYALLQTPEFVESFILDRTLDPAIAEFGLAEFRMIDPACGSGHFLLGSFRRLLDRWLRKEPGTNVRELVQRSLNSHGVDVNPYAVAIARFRLLLAAMRASGIERLRDAPAFRIQVACGDSLLHGEGNQLLLGDWAPMAHYFRSEDAAELNRMLVLGHYHAVVANPPYITPKDAALNAAYRKRYRSCHRQYSLAVPFMERIFQLAVDRGFTGQITANSFMKREFGKKLIEEFVPRVDLTHVIDTSGAYIPGHGTPTVILFGRNRRSIASTIRTVMGIRGEPSTPDVPAKGLVWSAILEQVDRSGAQSEFVSVTDSMRNAFHKHPWSIGGGGASELKELLDQAPVKILSDVVDEIGIASWPGLDDIFVCDLSTARRKKWEENTIKYFIPGDAVRNWSISPNEVAIAPYNQQGEVLQIESVPNCAKAWWASRTHLRTRVLISGKTVAEERLPDYVWVRWITQRYKASFRVTQAFIATHNHFSLCRGGNVFNRHAPVITLPFDQCSEQQYLFILGLLNSSISCFWGRQTLFSKGGFAAGKWEERLEWDGTKLLMFPIPNKCPTIPAKVIDKLAQQLDTNTPNVLLGEITSKTKEQLTVGRKEWAVTREQMIALQEELDWQCYQLYGLIDEDLTHSAPPPVALGQRAFEIVMARKMAAGELETTWFERHNSTPITELPSEWSDDYKQLVQRRIEIIERDRNIALIEQPEYKRRWNTEPWDSQLERALRNWLCDRLETYFDFDGRMNDDGKPTNKIDISLISIAQLADIARQDTDFLQVGELYRNDSAFDVQKLVTELIEAESVPLLPILRYKPTGIRKRIEWEHTWSLQRLEDAIDSRSKLPREHPDYVSEISAKALKQQELGDIPVPPKYTSSDFQKSHYWRLRGKLDVPKERWMSFPHCNAEDGTMMIAWAGYDHLQLALAISAYFVEVQERLGGRDDLRLLPLLASVIELLPWLKQWHNDLDPTYNQPMGDYFEAFIQDEVRQIGKTLDEVRLWQPPARNSRRR